MIRAVARGIERVGFVRGSGEEADAVVVERVDQVYEAAGLVAAVGRQVGMSSISSVWKACAIDR